MPETRWKDIDWEIPTTPGGNCSNPNIAVLMDIRDELKKLNALLHCPNFIRIPHTLSRISANTAKPRKPK